MRVLEAMAAHSGTFSLKELSDATGMSPSKLHRYLVSFVRTGVVAQHYDSGRYDLGVTARRIGLASLNRMDEFRESSGTLQKLRDQTGLSVMLSVWDNDGPRTVRWEAGIHPLAFTLRVGSTLPLSASATVLMFLAHLPRDMAERALKRGSVGNARRRLSPIKPDLIAKARAGRSIVTRSAVANSIDAIAAPVFNNQSSLSSVITIVAHEAELRDVGLAKARAALEDAAAHLSQTLGFNPAPHSRNTN
jgi:DNA-binding IclR family transcriptional regulator